MPHQFSIIAIILLIAFAIYRRVRRHIGWQLLSRKRILIRVTIFIVIGALLLTGGLAKPIVFISDAVGIVLGCVLAYFALRTTTFQEKNGKWYYKTNPLISIILIAIVLGRIVYRFSIAYGTISAIQKASVNGSQPNPADFNTYLSHPLTAGIIFILVAYYACFYLLVIRKKIQLR